MPIPGYSTRSFTVTITDKTQGPFKLSALYTAGSATGVTVAPSAGYPNMSKNVARLAVQFPANGSNGGWLYEGDSSTARDGTRQGAALQAGDTFSDPPRNAVAGGNDLNLDDHYIQTDTNNNLFNVQVWYA